jgi:methylated-DNA-[protein]-cysteine S-methyltransferase
MPATIYDSRIGPLTIAVDEAGALESIHFGAAGGSVRDEKRCANVVRQLGEYFRGERRDFDLLLAPRGTDFQLAVWSELQRIPYGTTISYAELARRIGRPAAVRAVGAANGANPIPIVIPCHRVIGSNGTLTGYGGGIENKHALLELEQPQRSLISRS